MSERTLAEQLAKSKDVPDTGLIPPPPTGNERPKSGS